MQGVPQLFDPLCCNALMRPVRSILQAFEFIELRRGRFLRKGDQICHIKMTFDEENAKYLTKKIRRARLDLTGAVDAARLLARRQSDPLSRWCDSI